MNKGVVDIQDLVFGHKQALVDMPVNLTACLGNLICIIGRNGTGKTTFLNTLIGVNRPLSGGIFINGTSLFEISSHKKSHYISFVPSKIENISNLRVYELVKLGRSPYTNIFDKQNAFDKQLISDCLCKLGLTGISDKQISEISDGERQKAMICRAIVQQTPIILLDEPTAFLDYFAKRSLLKELKTIAKDENRCIIFSCHDIEIATEFCTNVWLLDNRRLFSYSTEEFKDINYIKKYE